MSVYARSRMTGSWSVIGAVAAFGADTFQASMVPADMSCTQEAHGRPDQTGAKSVVGRFDLSRMDGASLAR